MPHITTADGVELFYDSFGAEADPALVLVQGLGAQMLGWNSHLCHLLAAAGFRVVRFDNRDVGQSQKFPAGGYRIADMASDTAGLIHALGLDSAHVVGQSMGGMIAQQLVLDHPRLVRSLALIYTAPSGRYISGLDVVDERMDRPQPHNRDEAIDLYVRNEEPCSSPAYATDIDWLREVGGQMYDRDPRGDGAARQLAAIHDSPDRTEALRGVKAPTVILHGDSDRLIDVAASAVLHECIAGSTFEIFPGMGHNLPAELWSSYRDLIVSNAARNSIADSRSVQTGLLRR